MGRYAAAKNQQSGAEQEAKWRWNADKEDAEGGGCAGRRGVLEGMVGKKILICICSGIYRRQFWASSRPGGSDSNRFRFNRVPHQCLPVQVGAHIFPHSIPSLVLPRPFSQLALWTSSIRKSSMPASAMSRHVFPTTRKSSCSFMPLRVCISRGMSSNV